MKITKKGKKQVQHYKNKTKKKKTITITSKESKTNIMYQLFIFTWLVVSSFSHPVKLNESEIESFDVKRIQEYLRVLTSSSYDCEIHKRFKILDDGWVTLYDGFQYKKTLQTKSWADTKSTCQSWGGDLVVHGIQDMGSRRLLFNALSITNSNIWIGLSYNGGKWVWVNGETAIPSAILWMPGEPNGKKEHCGELIASVSGGLGTIDRSCDTQRFGLCEKKL